MRRLSIVLLALLLFSSLFLSGICETKPSKPIPKSGKDKEDAPDIEMAVNYYVNRDDMYWNSWGMGNDNGWYRFVAPASDVYFFASTPLEYSTGFNVYNIYNELLAGTGVSFNDIVKKDDKVVLCIELEKGEVCYINISSYGSFFTICTEAKHTLLGERQTIVEPTCTEKGISAKLCESCGNGVEVENIIPTGHSLDEWETLSEPTCTEPGERQLCCTICGEVVEKETIPATGHMQGEEEIFTPATCIQTGEKGTRCVVCGEVVYREELPKTDHIYGVMEVIKTATCTTEGYNEQRCTLCNALLDSEITPALGHTPGIWQTIVPATCLDGGYKAITCTMCNLEMERKTIPAMGHDEGIWVTVHEPTRVENGLQELQCSRCGGVLDTKILPAYLDDKSQFSPEELIVLVNQALNGDMNMILDIIGSQPFIQGDETAVANIRAANGQYAGDFAVIDNGFRLDKRIESITFDENFCRVFAVATNTLLDVDIDLAETMYKDLFSEFVNVYVYAGDEYCSVESTDAVVLRMENYQAHDGIPHFRVSCLKKKD